MAPVQAAAGAGRPREVAPGVLRVTAPNRGPMTYRGTNSYLVGGATLAVIDPGPEHGGHLAALLSAIDGRRVSHILVTHHHRDHLGSARGLSAETGAPVLVGARAAPAAGANAGHPPLMEGDRFTGDGWTIEAVATPGHASDHFCFALPEAGAIFSGDHVMGWATSVIAPPDGSISAYVASLDRIAARPERLYLPGHGEPIPDGPERAHALKLHRQKREAAILHRLRSGPLDVTAIVQAVYRGLDPALLPAAEQSVRAHLADLDARGLIVADGPGSPRYRAIRT